MRKILLYTLMTLAAAGMASCEDFLTRDTYDQIGSDEFWNRKPTWNSMPTVSSRR